MARNSGEELRSLISLSKNLGSRLRTRNAQREKCSGFLFCFVFFT